MKTNEGSAHKTVPRSLSMTCTFVFKIFFSFWCENPVGSHNVTSLQLGDAYFLFIRGGGGLCHARLPSFLMTPAPHPLPTLGKRKILNGEGEVNQRAKFFFLFSGSTGDIPRSQLLWSQLQAAAHWRIQRADAISHGIWGTFTPMKYSNKGPKVVILRFLSAREWEAEQCRASCAHSLNYTLSKHSTLKINEACVFER